VREGEIHFIFQKSKKKLKILTKIQEKRVIVSDEKKRDVSLFSFFLLTMLYGVGF
jgi:hypothetical protein